MPEIMIIADDLTGALDSAVAFARPSQRVCVVRDTAKLTKQAIKSADILCINTNSREGSAEDATQKINDIAAHIDLLQVPLLIKKVDSRLKGHVKTESARLAELSGRTHFIAAPAIPDMGRIQQDGFLIGVGTGSGIKNAIPMTDKCPADTVLPDILSDGDFERVISTCKNNPLWIGARGLTFALARARCGAPISPPKILTGPMVLAIGSRDPITLAQVEMLTKYTAIHSAPNGLVPATTSEQGVTAIHLTPGETTITARQAGQVFADGICRALHRLQPRTLLICGGETANAILDTLKINILDVIVEVSAGLPLCRANSPWGQINILTKSGGFGGAELLSRLAQMVEFEQDELPNDESL